MTADAPPPAREGAGGADRPGEVIDDHGTGPHRQPATYEPAKGRARLVPACSGCRMLADRLRRLELDAAALRDALVAARAVVEREVNP